jgi:hypothetical protein
MAVEPYRPFKGLGPNRLLFIINLQIERTGLARTSVAAIPKDAKSDSGACSNKRINIPFPRDGNNSPQFKLIHFSLSSYSALDLLIQYYKFNNMFILPHVR